MKEARDLHVIRLARRFRSWQSSPPTGRPEELIGQWHLVVFKKTLGCEEGDAGTGFPSTLTRYADLAHRDIIGCWLRWSQRRGEQCLGNLDIY